MKNTKKLKAIVNVISGYNFRTALKTFNDISGNLVIQARDVPNNIYIDEGNLVKINFKNDKTKAFVKNNDIIISVRGKFRASVYTGSENNIIASSSVYILRLMNDRVSSEYLAIYLNSKIGQREINKALTGVVIQTIRRSDLEDLNILILNLKKQQSIIDLYRSNKKLDQILDKKKKLINEVVEVTINKILS